MQTNYEKIDHIGPNLLRAEFLDIVTPKLVVTTNQKMQKLGRCNLIGYYVLPPYDWSLQQARLNYTNKFCLFRIIME